MGWEGAAGAAARRGPIAGRRRQAVARGRLDGAGRAPVVRAAVWRHDPHLPLAGLRPMQTLVDAESARLRFISLLLDAVAAVALAITELGIVSLMIYLNRLRDSEVHEVREARRVAEDRRKVAAWAERSFTATCRMKGGT